MNNIKNFNEFTGTELEEIVYNQELNEGIMGKGIKGFFNKRAARKVRSELSDEIEMSKSIMEGIKEGIETLSENFDAIEKSLENSNEKKKGEKQKLLDDIKKILDNSRKSTWDLNELIDEGEIDYTGFTGNVGIASVAYFGILLTPFRAGVIIHKGYRYFFNIIKNTIRKSLVMLQLNFDQFENLIVTQSLRCAGVITATDTASEIEQFYGNLLAQIGSNKSLKPQQLKKFQTVLNTAKTQYEQQRKAIKDQDTAETLYNNLDPYNNTYTKSLESLRQYSGDDVQKQLDAIKSSINKLAGQEVDLQTFGELVIAAAEEHAYEVSSSIYNKFAKMTEVFSLPNQQKLIDLILAANKEEKAEAKKLRDEKKKAKELQKSIESKSKEAEDGINVFKSIDGVEIEELEGGEVSENAETKKYDESKIKADKWTYTEFSKLEKDDQDKFETWLNLHPEVLKKCSKSLQTYIKSNPTSVYADTSYIDSLIDYIEPCLSGKIDESYIMNFDEYYILKESVDDYDDYENNEDNKDTELRNKYYIDFENIDDSQIKDLTNLYKNKKIAIAGLESIAVKVLKSDTFKNNSENIVKIINDTLKSESEKKSEIKKATFKLLKESIKKLKDLRNHEYSSLEDDNPESSENTEKSEK